jgi:hypothetical protein
MQSQYSLGYRPPYFCAPYLKGPGQWPGVDWFKTSRSHH